jgi:CTP:molybdopterin cytidylyltransferase MocA
MAPGFLAQRPKSSAVALRAVVTSGGRVDGAFAAAIGSPVKALAPLGAGRLIDPVLLALRDCGIAEVAVVAGPEVAAHLAGTAARIIAAADDGATNVLRALDAWPPGDLVFTASDLPFVRAADLAAFLAASRDCDLTMPLAAGAAYEAAFPGAPPHVTALGAKRIANGSVFFIAAAAREPLRAVAGRFFDARKSLIGMARLLGPALLLRFLVRRLQIADVERRAQQALGIEAVAIRDAAPGLCFDVDTLADYRYACERG